MKITYTFSRESLRTGARKYLSHRHRFITFLLPPLGLVFTVFGFCQLFSSVDSAKTLAWILIALGAFYFYRFARLTRTIVKNAFASNPSKRQIHIETTDETFSIEDDGSSGSVKWSAFVDQKICKDGILLYPQKNIFYWIPDNASVEGGTWQDFEELVRKNITRKV